MDLPGWMRDPVLLPAWRRIAARLEAAGLVAVGKSVADVPDAATRHALEDLTGRRPLGTRFSIDLAALDDRLRLRYGHGVVGAAERVLGQALEDRPARRAAAEHGRSAPVIAARGVLEGTHLEDADWISEWFAAARADGLLVRGPLSTAAVVGAVRVLLAVTGPSAGRSNRTRTEIAAQVLHDAHALDDDRLTARLVLRALARRAGRPAPVDATQRRDLWDGVGVLPDLVSTTCATLDLRWLPGTEMGAGPVDPGRPLHVTGWDVRRTRLLPVRDQVVLVCENPSVLQAFAERGAGGPAVVCTSGRPNLAVQAVLHALDDADATLFYHGDFDWSGVAIANQVRARFGARPWRMSAADYELAPGQIALHGPDDVQPSWDAELGAAMRRRGVAVHEEAVIGTLLEAAGELG